MELKIKDRNNGTVYSNDMSSQNKHCILSINFCTSYTQVEVQDEIEENGVKKFPSHTVILPPYGVKSEDVYWVDLIAVQECARGEWVLDSYSEDDYTPHFLEWRGRYFKTNNKYTQIWVTKASRKYTTQDLHKFYERAMGQSSFKLN